MALGVPPEDLIGLDALAKTPDKVGELQELDEAEVRFQHWLEDFGAVRVPSPDMETAHRLAADLVPLHALDLDDLAHSHAYTTRMKVRHLVRSASRRRKVLAADFGACPDAYSLAVAWDEGLAVKPLRAMDAEREAHMAAGLVALARPGERILAVVPVTRLAGILAALRLAP